MKALIQVYNQIDNDNIKVFDYKIPFRCPAVTIEIDGNYGIFVDYGQIDTEDDEFMTMAHEWGHCKTGTTHPIGIDDVIIRKHEYKANRQAVLTFLPFNRLLDAFRSGCKFPFEIAEHLELPENFITMALEHYKAMGKI